jgi:hypothetical protein
MRRFAIDGAARGQATVEDHDERAARAWWAIPRPPWWSYLLLVLADAGTGIWNAIASDGNAVHLFFAGLLWPGAAVAGIVFIVAYLGWNLDLE